MYRGHQTAIVEYSSSFMQISTQLQAVFAGQETLNQNTSALAQAQAHHKELEKTVQAQVAAGDAFRQHAEASNGRIQNYENELAAADQMMIRMQEALVPSNGAIIKIE